MSTEISIKQIPAVTEINNNDLLLVQTTNSTNSLKFENFVVGLENTTFAPVISANSTNIGYVSSVIDETFFEAPTISNGPNLLTDDTTSIANSARPTSMIPINITSGGEKRTYYFLLSGGDPVT